MRAMRSYKWTGSQSGLKLGFGIVVGAPKGLGRAALVALPSYYACNMAKCRPGGRDRHGDEGRATWTGRSSNACVDVLD